jgi:xeroderma pigmentosum group C-complementing protein
MSLTPLALQNAFQSFSPRTHPNERDRSRLFDAALRDLVSWWWQSFTIEEGIGIRSRPWSEVEAEIEALGIKTLAELADPSLAVARRENAGGSSSRKGKGKATVVVEPPPPESSILELATRGEKIRSAQSLMKRALLMRGSRDMSAQLFTALCRALDIPARLVFSLQPVDWKLSNDKQAAATPSNASTPSQTKTTTGVMGTTGTKRKRQPNAPMVAAARKAAEAMRISFDASHRSRFKNANELTSGESASASASAQVSESESEPEMDEVPIILSPAASSSLGRLSREELGGGGGSGKGTGTLSRPISISESNNSRANSDAEGAATGSTPTTNTTPGTTTTGTLAERRRAVPVKLRKSRPKKKLNFVKSPSPAPDDMSRPPVFWTEVYSRANKEWITVDVTRKKVRAPRGIMEPAKANRENKLIYVVALEEGEFFFVLPSFPPDCHDTYGRDTDNYVRDITPRYTKAFGARILKSRVPTRKGYDWWEDTIAHFRRPYQLVGERLLILPGAFLGAK